jgi:hypothetical protein
VKNTGDRTYDISVDCGQLLSFGETHSRWCAEVRSETYCKDVEEGDILWQMADVVNPIIVRFCVDHFDVIAISVDVIALTMKSFVAFGQPRVPEFMID